jgi:hypothetical protein
MLKSLKINILYNSALTKHHSLFILFLCFIILFSREPDGFLNPQFWAEDATIFFKQNFTLGVEAIWQPYAGYLHLVPRLIAYISGFFPTLWIPALYNFSFIILTLFVINYLLSSRIDLSFKPLLAIAIVLVPYNGEILMSITYIQWLLAILIILFIIQEKPNSNQQLLLDTIIITVTGLTGPFILLFLPLFVFRFIYICRSYYSIYIFCIALLLCFIQGYFIFQTENINNSENSSYSLEILGQILAMRFSGALFFGEYISLAINYYLLLFISIIILFGLLILGIFNINNRQLPILIFLISGIIVIVSTLYKFRYDLDPLIQFDYGTRYVYILHLFTIWSLILLLNSNGFIKYISALLLLIFLLSTFTHFQATPLTNYHWEKYYKHIEQGDAVKVPINPNWSLCFNNCQNKNVYPMFHSTPYKVSSPNQEAVENTHLVLMVHAPGEMRFKLSSGKHKLSGQFGILKGAYSAETKFPTDGVEFSAVITDQNGQESILFKRFLNPLLVAQDRGLHNFIIISFETENNAELVLRTNPGANGNSDWSFWNAIKIDNLN